MKRKKFALFVIAALTVLSLLFALAGCDPLDTVDTPEDTVDTVINEVSPVVISESTFEANDTYAAPSSAVSITLNGGTISAGAGVSVSGTTATISSPGSYLVTGTLDNGQLVINAAKTATVTVYLSNASIHCSDNPAIYVKSADKVILSLVSGTQNNISDGASYTLTAGEDEPDAVLFSESDLSINGTGLLSVTANYNDGIKCKDDLKIMEGTLDIHAVEDGITGRDALYIKDGILSITSGGDGIKATNEDNDKGYVAILGGTITIVSAADGIQAESSLLISAGDITITSGGGSTTAKDTGKGLKATADISVTGGTFTIQSADDAIHTNDSVNISGGSFEISTADDGIHADSYLAVSDGVIHIAKCYEGIESQVIHIAGGEITLVSSDDGINAAGGSSSTTAGRPGQGVYEQSQSNCSINITGGKVFINASGDGVDANGSVTMSGGILAVDGPTATNNGSLDYDGTFVVTGGTIAAGGSAGMVQTPSGTSTLYSISIYFSSSLAANTPVALYDSDGNLVMAFLSAKKVSQLTLTSPSIAKGSYKIYTGGTVSGEQFGGIYSAASGGTLAYSVTVSSKTTTAGSSSGGGMGR